MDNFSASIICEEVDPKLVESGQVPYIATVKGRFLAEGAHSANRRTYVKIAESLREAQAAIDCGKVLDMRTHHETDGNTLNIAGRLTKVTEDGGYEGILAPTEAGHTLKALIKGGFLDSVSLRAAAFQASEMKAEDAPDRKPGWYEVRKFNLKGIDFTNNPGIGFASTAMEHADSGVLTESFDLRKGQPMTEENKTENDGLGLDAALTEAGKAPAEAKTEAKTEEKTEAKSGTIGEDVDNVLNEAKAKTEAEAGRLGTIEKTLETLSKAVEALLKGAPASTETAPTTPAPTAKAPAPTETTDVAAFEARLTAALESAVKKIDETFDSKLQAKLDESRGRSTFVAREVTEETKTAIESATLTDAIDAELHRLGIA